MNKENMKLFVGGYYDSRIFKGDSYEGKTPFDKDINTYTLEEALKLGFVEPVVEWFEEEKEKGWDELSFEEKAKAIEEYTLDDEIAGLNYFPTEKEAKDYKKEVLEKIAKIELESEYEQKIEDRQGFYRDIYIKSLDDVLSLQEAANMWGLDDSTLRHAIANGRFEEGEYRKTGRNYIIKKSAMERVYGKKD